MLKAKRAKPASEIIRDPLRCFFVESVQGVVGRDHGDRQGAAEKSWIIGWLREQRTFAPKPSTNVHGSRPEHREHFLRVASIPAGGTAACR